MRRVLAVGAAMLLGLILSASGCGGGHESTTTTVRETVSVPRYADPWVFIQGDSIKIALPKEWDGGDPSDPAVAAASERVWGEDEAASYHDQVGEGADFVLLAWLGFDGGVMGHVHAIRGPWPEPSSMQDIVEQLTGRTTDRKVTIESVTADRAYVVLSSGNEKPEEGSELQHIVFLKRGSYFYLVFYGCDESWADKADPTFRTSAETIVVE